jgi:hypothetical protein
LETVDDALARFETRTKSTIKDKCKNLVEHFTFSIDGEIDGLRPEEATPMNCENLLLELKSLWTNLHDTKNEKEAKSPFTLLTEEKDANKPAPIRPTKVIAPEEEFLSDAEEEIDVKKVKVKCLSCKQLLDWILIGRNHVLYQNVTTALRIPLTFPVSVASAERSFSKLTLIKSYLRSTVGQERLGGLALMSIEKEITATLNAKDIISRFWAMQTRKTVLHLL